MEQNERRLWKWIVDKVFFFISAILEFRENTIFWSDFFIKFQDQKWLRFNEILSDPVRPCSLFWFTTKHVWCCCYFEQYLNENTEWNKSILKLSIYLFFPPTSFEHSWEKNVDKNTKSSKCFLNTLKYKFLFFFFRFLTNIFPN